MPNCFRVVPVPLPWPVNLFGDHPLLTRASHAESDTNTDRHLFTDHLSTLPAHSINKPRQSSRYGDHWDSKRRPRCSRSSFVVTSCRFAFPTSFNAIYEQQLRTPDYETQTRTRPRQCISLCLPVKHQILRHMRSVIPDRSGGGYKRWLS